MNRLEFQGKECAIRQLAGPYLLRRACKNDDLNIIEFFRMGGQVKRNIR